MYLVTIRTIKNTIIRKMGKNKLHSIIEYPSDSFSNFTYNVSKGIVDKPKENKFTI